MSNAQDLLSILGGAGGASNRPSASRAGGVGSTTSGTTETSILNFKAGKMNTRLKPNGKYLVEPDSRRGELHIVWTTAGAAVAGGSVGHLKLEWKDRRTKTTVNTIPIFPADDATFERVETGREGDRVYLLQCGNNNADSRHFFWMQDKDVEPDEDICVKVNLYMSDYSEAVSAAGIATSTTAGGATTAGAGGMDNAELLRIMQGALGGSQGGIHDAIDAEGARTSTVPGSDSIPTSTTNGSAGGQQVDALGNILENLGMPNNGTPNNAAAATTAGGLGGLTLADLQGAMAGLATASPPSAATATAGPPLSELASSSIISESGILNDPSMVARLIALLPEGQRTESQLRENIRSPQVAQCLQRLTSALAEEGASSFNSIIANFQLDPSDGAEAMAGGNPIEAFLNCLLKDVERKEGVKRIDEEEKEMDGEEGGGSGETKEDGGNDGDGKMDES
eukprot:CAMPEP_0201865540 /NCGR_PEP_ID=MMETSP0902-20130614/384_1 /ASSEMBLY_ACC=CAM_ASM_000551 /TAXON_ID=420261 /ORGANISM="Thalassiosira antarctica, Strain CCMP982" /LENGTH=452 /DNA_ID=CAMNT_0048390305 /DNA_START=65 /DNA_END=1423 /DNA_ORIENTATION=+